MASMPIRKDPAGFKTTELANARILAGLVLDFEELLLRSVDRMKGDRKLASLIPGGVWKAALIVPFPAEFLSLIDSVDQIEMVIDKAPAERAAERIVWSAQAQGLRWASKNLQRVGLEKPDPVVAWAGGGKFGITDMIPSTTNAKPFILPPDPKMIAMYKERVRSEIKNLSGAQATAIKREIAKAFENGETVQQITHRIKKTTEMAKSKAVTIARTETLAAGNAAAKQRYKDAGVEMVEWIAAYDDSVCPECESEHGNIYPIGDTPPIPLHPNCRCTLIPYREKEE